MPYFIREDYTPRLDNDFDDERGRKDECQDEVYKEAKHLADAHGLKSVLDIGTGGGFKLMKYFPNRTTLGIDLPQTIEWVKQVYPERNGREWKTIPLDGEAPQGYDLIIAADIIEHLPDPDQLLNFIVRCKPKYIVISTPNRDNLAEHSWAGPPRNLSHVREWSAAEFRQYMDQWFQIEKHIFPNPERRDYSTMWVIGKIKDAQ